MCGRYASFREAQDLADAFALEDLADDAATLPPSWNLAPTDPVRIVVERTARDAPPESPPVRSLRLARWGLVPGWAKDPSVGARMINARAETLAERPAFRRALASRRCLVPAEGYYEWTPPPPGSPARTPKVPHWIHPADGRVLAFAGLYEFWRDPTLADDDPARWLVSTTIVTGGAGPDGAAAALHDRRPVILAPGRWDAWLDPGTDAPTALGLLDDPAPSLDAWTVSTAVNSATSEGPELIAPV
ncbi:SOS response-associated peptidase [Actinotalea sp.]|uniref:SOS response-associated peptidase n=1 Tax=Actinotalea sp. TaxID=1872145 RepID=UPI0035639747